MIKVAEQLRAGHPDKVCDAIADAILDEFVRRDEKTRANIVVFGGHGALMISGEVESRGDFDAAEVAKRVYKEAGLEDEVEPFVHLGPPRAEWSGLGAKGAAVAGAVCTGYATRATREFLPPAFVFATDVARRLDEARVHDVLMRSLRPDGRVLVALEGSRVAEVSVEVEHTENATLQQVYGDVLERILKPALGLLEGVKLFVNPAGPFVKGGLAAKVGQSGISFPLDLYGGLFPTSGGGISGKDGAHPLRAGTYMSRFIAKSAVAEGLASQAAVKIVFVPGRVDPVAFEVLGDAGADLTETMRARFDLRLEAVVERFGLRTPLFRRFSAYGPFAHTSAPWEVMERRP